MSMFKDRVLLFLECINIAMRDTQSELRKIREEKEIQTILLRRIAENQTSANKETNKPQEAAPAPEEITWRAAVRYLRDCCKSVTVTECNGGVCPMASFCDKHLKQDGLRMPCNWSVPGDE